jgi:hypothetical protein
MLLSVQVIANRAFPSSERPTVLLGLENGKAVTYMSTSIRYNRNKAEFAGF